MEENYIKVGSIVATHGTEGELIIRHNLGRKSVFPGVETFFIEMIRDSFLPYFPQQIRARNEDEIIVRLESVSTREMALGLLKKNVWLPEKLVAKIAAKNAPVSMLGYMVQNDGADLGVVLEVIEQPQQILLRLEIETKEVLVPLNESTLKKIDHKTRMILVSLPDGLIDIYLKR